MLRDEDPKALAGQVGQIVRQYIDEQLTPLRVELTPMRKDLEARQYRGIGDAATTYLRHNSVTHAGSVDRAYRYEAAAGRWSRLTLAVKRGRDGEDSRVVDEAPDRMTL